ncbi:uncharacterized protein MONOS_17967 [Monocercomonoides exilis]|uniref:uncharacterized protein n=1 Tax=Monocercomonoides exilis TaxID=2049356 RepID=UPI003559CFA1|nr:hypothetical protein MONOS_17967 [Monocercomonoides exilis]
MIIEEEQKNEGKNEKLLVDLCECYVFMQGLNSRRLHSTCMQCLLKVALNKEENEKTQKEVEMALFELSHINRYCFIKQELYVSEIKEIVKRLCNDNSLAGVIVNKLHFVREAARELEELTRCIDWKRKEGINGMKESKEELILIRWMYTLDIFLSLCKVCNEEYNGLINCVVQAFRAAKDKHGETCNQCIKPLRRAAENRAVKVDALLDEGAIDLISGEMKQSTLNDVFIMHCFLIYMNVSKRLKEKNKDEMEEMKRKATKRVIYEKMEKEGYEDEIISFHETFDNFYASHDAELASKLADYFVNV